MRSTRMSRMRWKMSKMRMRRVAEMIRRIEMTRSMRMSIMMMTRIRTRRLTKKSLH